MTSILDGHRREIQDGCTDYGHPGSIPYGPKLSIYPLHTPEWRAAFLERLVAIGEIGVFEAAARVYDLLEEPKGYRCALVAQAAGVAGSAKQVLVKTLVKYLDEWLSPAPPLPSRLDFESLAEWHDAAMSVWSSENERERWVVRKFAAALNGQVIPERVRQEAVSDVVMGPWAIATQRVGGSRSLRSKREARQAPSGRADLLDANGARLG